MRVSLRTEALVSVSQSTNCVPGSRSIFVVIADNTLYESIFIIRQESLDIKIMFHEDI